MADRKVTSMPELVTPAGVDLLYIIDNPTVNAVSKKISLDQFFRKIPANTSITGSLSVSEAVVFTGDRANISANVVVTGQTTVNTFVIDSNGLVINNKLTPANSNPSGVTTGKIFFDSNYLYIKVANTTVKRIALTSF